MKLDLEKAVIVGFFVLMLWLGLGTFWNHELAHDFPFGYSAADSYQHQVRAEWVKQQGNYAFEAPEIVTGFQDVVGYYMPGASHLAAIFSYTSGLESYDALYFMVFFVAVLSVLVMYYALRKFNKHVAMLSLPITTLVFVQTFYIGIILGQWPFTFGTLFLVGSFWAITQLELPRSMLLLALFISSVALTHTSELVFVVGLVGVAALIALLSKNVRELKILIGAGVITVVVSIYYLVIFSFTWGKQFGYRFFVEHVNGGYPNVRIFQDFQLWIIFVMLVGMISIYYRNAIVSVISAAVFLSVVKLFNLSAKLTSDASVVIVYTAFILLFLFVVVRKKPEFAVLLYF